MNRLKVLLMVVLMSVLGLVFATISMADGKGNPRKGKFLFRKNCRACHAKNTSAKGGGKVLQPSSKKQAGWKITFQNENYKKVECIKNWDKLSKKDINDIYLFLYEHASDSPSPVNCSDN